MDCISPRTHCVSGSTSWLRKLASWRKRERSRLRCITVWMRLDSLILMATDRSCSSSLSAYLQEQQQNRVAAEHYKRVWKCSNIILSFWGENGCRINFTIHTHTHTHTHCACAAMAEHLQMLNLWAYVHDKVEHDVVYLDVCQVLQSSVHLGLQDVLHD